jgi:hypothetical protein
LKFNNNQSDSNNFRLDKLITIKEYLELKFSGSHEDCEELLIKEDFDSNMENKFAN